MNFLKKNFLIKNNIICTNINDKVTNMVAGFYNIKPFPNYKSNDNKSSILDKGNKNKIAHQFKEFMGYKKKILEVGCGTGQIINYFSIGTNNETVGLDATLESLKIASDFAIKNEIKNVQFLNADIFEDVLKDDYFDFIWSNGVLHHTKNPYEAFKIILKSLKSKGYILVGLYNKFGRTNTIIRRHLYKIFGERFLMIFDPTLRKLKIHKDEQQAWIRDQYIHPVESLHTIDEILSWFDKNNIEFISSIPSSSFEDYSSYNIFEKKSLGTKYSRIINQISMIFGNLGSDGGLFIVVGKKK